MNARCEPHVTRDGKLATRALIMLGIIGPIVAIVEGRGDVAREAAIAKLESILQSALDEVRALRSR